MRISDIIEIKKHGGELTEEQIYFTVNSFVNEEIADYQMSALLMAICIRGMNPTETAVLTRAMLESGDSVDLSRFGSRSVDKHSTGGVGDKTTLIVAPIVASLGGVVAKMSGRGLGHTGGTIDKLESIKGFNTALSSKRFSELAEKIGIVVAGQTGNLAPADKKIYALRDVTGTVDSIPLIASSIMSKKLASGAKSIVLDVKSGSGAFMKTQEDAQRLARAMVDIGLNCGRSMTALVTDMDAPLGCAVGNSLEVIEAVSILKGCGSKTLRTLCVALAANMLSLCLSKGYEECVELAENAIDNGSAFEKMKEWVSAQGGDSSWLENTELFPKAPYEYCVKCDRDAYITRVNSERIGEASVVLGAGRLKKGDAVDMSAGIILEAKPSDYVKAGDVLARLYTSDKSSIPDAEKLLTGAVEYGACPPEKSDIILATIK